MKRKKTSIKKTIQKKIEIKSNGVALPKYNVKKKIGLNQQRIETRGSNLKQRQGTNVKKMDRELARRHGNTKSGHVILSKENMVGVRLMSDKQKLQKYGTLKISESIEYPIRNFGEYVKKENVDYDAVIIISSYNRYFKIKRILTQLFTQDTEYTYKIILVNDGSVGYESIPKEFPKIDYFLNKKNGGVKKYWQTFNKSLSAARKYKTHAVIQIDDDFILCDGFIDKLMNKFFELKNENNSYMLLKYHLGKLDNNLINENTYFDTKITFQAVDGGTLFDVEFLNMISYTIEDVTNKAGTIGSLVWNFLNSKIKELGVMAYVFRRSLAYHDGNEDSQMHPTVRGKRKYYTVNYIDEKKE